MKVILPDQTYVEQDFVAFGEYYDLSWAPTTMELESTMDPNSTLEP
jgi:hypothetical protein